MWQGTQWVLAFFAAYAAIAAAVVALDSRGTSVASSWTSTTTFGFAAA